MLSVPRSFVRFSTAALVVVALGSGAASGTFAGRSIDPAGDVTTATSSVGQQERDTVDVRRVSYGFTERRLTVITTVVDLSVYANFNQFFETAVRGGGESLTLSSELVSDTVKVFTGSTLTTCRGSVASVNYAENKIRQSVPLRCLSDSDTISMRSRSLLARPDGSRLAVDCAVGTEQFFLG